MCYAVAYVLNITDNLNKMFYLIQVAYLYIIIFRVQNLYRFDIFPSYFFRNGYEVGIEFHLKWY